MWPLAGPSVVCLPHGSGSLLLRPTANSGPPTRLYKGNTLQCLQQRRPLPAVRQIPPPSASLRPSPPGSSPSPSHHKRPLPFSKSRRLSPSPLRGIFLTFSPHPLPLPSRLFAKMATHIL